MDSARREFKHSCINWGGFVATVVALALAAEKGFIPDLEYLYAEKLVMTGLL